MSVADMLIKHISRSMAGTFWQMQITLVNLQGLPYHSMIDYKSNLYAVSNF